MPYIKQADRPRYDNILNQIPSIYTKGELEYCLFKILKLYMCDKEFCYKNLHDTTYAATHVADEFRRRYLDKREDDAMKDNGDIEWNQNGDTEI